MFEFLGEPWEPEVMDYDARPHHTGFGDPDVARRRRIEPNSGNYRDWPPATQRSVRAACEPTLSAIGYG
jgi:hypothetical protein